MTDGFKTLKYETPCSGVALVTLSRPERLNALDGTLRRELAGVLCRISADSDILVAVITGAGRAFCSGADIGSVDGTCSIEDVLNTEYHAFLSTIRTMPKPVIAAVNGVAAGIGMSLVLTCDLRIMSEDAFLTCAFSGIGLVPDGGLSWLLTHQVGYARAYELAAFSGKIDAEQARDLGLVNRIAPAENLLSPALEWAESLTKRAPVSMALTKRVFRAACEDGLRNAMAFEAMTQRTAAATEDCAEGIKALLEKRKPVFRGR